MKDLNADVDSLGGGSSGCISVDTMGEEEMIAHQWALSNKVEVAAAAVEGW